MDGQVKKFKIVAAGVHTIDYVTDGVTPELSAGKNLSRVGPMRTHPGGIGNGLPVAAKLFGDGNVGCVTLLCDDANGKDFFAFMEENGVDTGGVLWNTQLPPDKVYTVLGPDGKPTHIKPSDLSTGMSFVNVDIVNKDPLIFYSGGANNVFSREHVNMDYVAQAEAFVVSYGTLLPALDAENGAEMRNLLHDARQRGVLTMLDTHSIPGADYTVLNEPLKEVDIFGCNLNEARSITGLGDDARAPELLAALADKMEVDGSRARLVAMTRKEQGAALAYFKPGEKSPVAVVEIPACEVEVVDGTGAGDTFKMGLMAYIVEHRKEFEAGTMNLEEAGQFANTTAASYISGRGIENVRSYAETEEAMKVHYAQKLRIQDSGLPIPERHTVRRTEKA
ncbi:MAG: carbohydrate kinase family protein [Candidatus Altiarchaeota archaeon]